MICWLPESSSVAAVRIWLVASVAMNEFTRSRTTTSPDSNPTAAQARIATRLPVTGSSVAFWASALTMTSENASMFPTERSKTPATSGTSSARPRMPTTTMSAATTLNVVAVRKLSGIQSPNSTTMTASRYSALTRESPGRCNGERPDGVA